jgi:hypothetical protein
MVKKALLGLHEPNSIENRSYSSLLKGKNFEIDYGSSSAELSELAKNCEYQVCIMDANLGFPGSMHIMPCTDLYNQLFPNIESGKVKFLAISGKESVVASVRERGIPAEVKGSDEFIDFMMNL